MIMSFTHLQIRSGYSFMESSVQIPPLIQRAKELNFKALALTDESVLYNAIPFYKACVAHGIKPIFGLTLTFMYENDEVEAIVLAKSNEGYEQLIKISTLMQTQNLVDFTELFEETSALIMIVQTKTVALTNLLRQDNVQTLSNWLAGFEGKFLRENIYLGLERMNEADDELITQAKQFAKVTSIKAVALHDVRYVHENEWNSFDCLQAIKDNRSWDFTKANEKNQGRHLRSTVEMEAAFNLWKEAVQRTEEIAASCTVSFSFDEIQLPKFPLAAGETAELYIRKRCERALVNTYPEAKQYEAAKQRLAYELSVINQLEFNDYFLIVADFVQYAKDNQIAVGPGRGSAAGSLVAYLLGITDVDPLEYSLLFERFLNPERVSMPDIDIDFSDQRRDEVIDYVRKKYGDDYVAQIITFGTFAARSILREVMKTMEINENDQKYILRHIPQDTSQKIADSVRNEHELVKYVKHSKKLRTLFAVAVQLEGLPRHMSVHAAGIVVGKRPLIKDVPLTKGAHGTNVTQYAMHELEAIGLLKMDILGLKNLTLIERVVSLIQRREDKDFSLAEINEADAKTFSLLQKGQTNGVFQFESSGMKQMLMKVKPTEFNELAALNALYRPGPMKYIDTYAKRKHGQEKVTYVHEDLQPILEETYGVLVYQEQIMQIVHKFASFSLGEADLLRRAISKKSRAGIEAQKERFIKGCLQNGYSQNVAEQLFEWIVTFANYGFNKSHSVAYSKVAYSLAYLKAHYPAYFFASLLSSSFGEDAKKRVSYMREASDFGISVLPPSINHSYAYFTVEKDAVRIGLMAIKGIGYDTIQTIVAARKEQAFRDFFDFVLRVKIKRNALETLILAGAFDDTYPNRASLLASITPALERAELFGDYGEGALFKDSIQMRADYVEMEDFTVMQKLADEKELLSTYISNHPLKEKRAALTAENYTSIAAVKQLRPNTTCRLIVFAQAVKKIRTKRGDSMAFVTLADETDELEAVVFSNVWREVSRFLEEDHLYRIEGRASERNGEKQLIINQVAPYSLEDLLDNKYVYLRIKDQDYASTLTFLAELAEEYSGKSKVIIYNETTKESFKLSEKYMLSCDESCMQSLIAYFGAENVVLK